jgi:hypothetical protein
MGLWKKLAVVAACWAGAVGPAQACSVEKGYVWPTNFELLEIADAVVVATASGEGRLPGVPAVTFRVEERLKGSPPSRLALPHTHLGESSPSDLTNITEAFAHGPFGACYRKAFRKGERYLLIIHRNAQGGWEAGEIPLSRSGEDHEGDDTVWARSVRRYLRVQREHPADGRIAALARMLADGRDHDGKPLRPEELADIRDHLRSITPYKPTRYLIDAYERVERGQPLPYRAAGEAADGKPPMPAKPPREVKLRILNALAEGKHADARPLFDRLAAEAGDDPGIAGLRLRFLARNGAYPEAFAWIETRLMNLLPRLEPDDARALIRDVAEIQIFPAEDSDEALWQRDARAKAVWPELALSLHWFQKEALAGGFDFGEAIAAIPRPDYRSRRRLTLALAQSVDGEVTRWAVAELADEAQRRQWEKRVEENGPEAAGEDPARLPLEALLIGWDSENQEIVERQFCHGAKRRSLLIRLLGEVADPVYEGMLERALSTPELVREHGDELMSAFVQLKGRYPEREGVSEAELALLKQVVAGSPSKGFPLAPLTCS